MTGLLQMMVGSILHVLPAAIDLALVVAVLNHVRASKLGPP
jgi:hypothetical protein